jgi:hypothetical protein
VETSVHSMHDPQLLRALEQLTFSIDCQSPPPLPSPSPFKLIQSSSQEPLRDTSARVNSLLPVLCLLRLTYPGPSCPSGRPPRKADAPPDAFQRSSRFPSAYSEQAAAVSGLWFGRRVVSMIYQ